MAKLKPETIRRQVDRQKAETSIKSYMDELQSDWNEYYDADCLPSLRHVHIKDMITECARLQIHLVSLLELLHEPTETE